MQLFCPGAKISELCDDGGLYEDFNMDEMDLNLENYDELFGVTLNHSEELLENGGIDSLFGAKEPSAADSDCQAAVTAEVISSPFLLFTLFSCNCSMSLNLLYLGPTTDFFLLLVIIKRILRFFQDLILMHCMLWKF